jgi:hypothetical protein
VTDSVPPSGHADNRRSVGGLQRRMSDEIEPALWIDRRHTRFSRLTTHPLFHQMHAQMLAGVSPAGIAAWIQQRVDPDDVLGAARHEAREMTRDEVNCSQELTLT